MPSMLNNESRIFQADCRLETAMVLQVLSKTGHQLEKLLSKGTTVGLFKLDCGAVWRQPGSRAAGVVLYH